MQMLLLHPFSAPNPRQTNSITYEAMFHTCSHTTVQLGLENRCAGLDLHGDPLVAINAAVPFEMFRLKLKTALIKGGLRRSEADRKSAAGRKPWDEVLIFRVLVLQAL